MKKFKYPFLNPALPLKKRVADLLSRLTEAEKIGLLPHNQKAIERLGVGESRFGIEVARGYVSRDEGNVSTVFPQPIGMASTFNPELMYELGEIAGIETRIYHNRANVNAATPTKRNQIELWENNDGQQAASLMRLFVWGPTVDLCRNPLWGRNEESYGEDPFLTGEMSKAYTLGMRGNNKKYLRVLAGLKHFCCNNHEEDRMRDSADVDTRLLREYYYAAFEPAIRAKGAHSLMTAYNELSGVPGMINPDIKKVCKKEWGMLFSVTDGGDFVQNVNAHKYSDSHAETIALALKAGNNIMVDSDVTTIAAAKEALKSGLLSTKELDSAISGVLTARFMLGEFDPPESNPYNAIPDEMLNCDDFKAVTARAVRECVTLLKNDGLLPLKDDGRCKIAVVGHLAENKYKDWYTGMSDYNTTILQGLRDGLGENGEKRVSYHDGCDIVAIKSLFNNKYLQVKEDGSVVADADEIIPACHFKTIDWSTVKSREVIYISQFNGKLLRLKECDTEAAISSDVPVGFVDAVGNDTYEWFGRMLIRPSGYEYGEFIYKSWRNKDLAVDENGRFCEVEGGGITARKMFEEEVIVCGVKECEKLARDADCVIICVGNDPMIPARECTDRKTLELPFTQQFLVDTVCNVNKNNVLTITSSYPYIIPQSEDENTPASVIYTAHGGPEAGNAMADVLLGKYNPAGRLAQTWYKNDHDVPSLKSYDIASNRSTYLYFEGEELFPFGHGLSYSSFEYSGFSVKENGDEIEATVTVTNTSDVYGEEVVQLYFTALNPRVKRPKKQLCEFIRQVIEPGQSVEITLAFSQSRLRFWDVTRGKFAVETGKYRFSAGASSRDLRCSAEMEVKGEKIPLRNMEKSTPAINYDDKRAISLRYDKKSERHYVHSPNWSGALDFYDVDLTEINGIKVAASTDVGDGKITVFVKDKPVGEISVPASSCPTEFKNHICRFTKPLKGKGKLTLKFTQYMNLLDVKLLKF